VLLQAALIGEKCNGFIGNRTRDLLASVNYAVALATQGKTYSQK
jgi:hypothetical protein